ncbi:MAG TPA: NADH-quinone oxidoreductase subunit C [Desulfurococcaceae archaeon]|nr:NADH-quinone oxidoreductase subunit C [Desulfurococcaceae archaeon]
MKPNRKIFHIEASKIRDVVKRLIDVYGAESLYLSTIVGVDKPNENVIEINYFINIITLKQTIALRTRVPRDNPRIPSLLDLLPGALAGECETYDLLGVIFEGNQYLRRTFFVPIDVAQQGIYPLRKDAKV